MHIPFRYKLSVLFMLVSISIALIGGYILYTKTYDLVLKQLGSHLLDMGKTGAYLFGPEERAAIMRLTAETRRDALQLDLAQIAATEEGGSLETLAPDVAERYMNNPDFLMLVQKLRQIKQASRSKVRPYPKSQLPQQPHDLEADPFRLAYSYLAVPFVGADDYSVSVLLVDSDYKAMGDNEGLRPATIFREFSSDPVLKRTFLSGEATSGKEFVTDQWSTVLSTGIPLKDNNGRTFAILGLDLNVSSEVNGLKELQLLGLIILVGILIVTALLSHYVANQLSRPIQALREGAESVRAGDLTTQVQVKSKDEFGILATTFNSMVEQIRSYTQELEQKVQVRTKELSQALNQLKSSQTRLVQSEKMAMIGQMVAGVAHEINTPLGYVKNNLLSLIEDTLPPINSLLTAGQQLDQTLKNEAATEEEMNTALSDLTTITQDLTEQELAQTAKDLADDAMFGVNQISELVVSLKDFARLDQAKTKAVDIHECIESALRIGKDKLQGVVEVTKNYGSDIPRITCSPAKINQIVLNLLNNATDAIQEQGNEGEVVITTAADNQHVSIVIRDNGKGISKENLTKVFEPFFTTKGAGVGTGLGLAICNQIIEEHQGHISVESEEGQGATFTILLPISPSGDVDTVAES